MLNVDMANEVVKVSWSGGKDSTCAELLHIKAEHHTKVCNYIPMFTKEIPLILKRHYDFIIDTANKFKNMGAEVFFADGITYWDYVHYRSTRGKYKGRAFGFPVPQNGRCGFKRDSKQKAIENLSVGSFDWQDIGIAFDEVRRKNQLNEHKRSILCEQKITESMAFEICRQHNMLSPHYKDGNMRDGCVLCFNAKCKERNEWFKDYPQARELVIELQEFVKKERPNTFPLRNKEWFIETDNIQPTIFDLLENEKWKN